MTPREEAHLISLDEFDRVPEVYGPESWDGWREFWHGIDSEDMAPKPLPAAFLRATVSPEDEPRRANPKRTRLHREHGISSAQNIRAKRAGLFGKLRGIELRTILEAQSYRCAYCESNRDALTFDHVVPLFLGGANVATNILAACGPCNSSKGRRSLEEWLSDQAMGRVVALHAHVLHCLSFLEL